MTTKMLLLTSLIAGVLAAVIVAGVTRLVTGQLLVKDLLTAGSIGFGSIFGIFFIFKTGMGKKGGCSLGKKTSQ